MGERTEREHGHGSTVVGHEGGWLLRHATFLSPEQLDTLLEKAKPTPMLSTYMLLLADTGRRAEPEALQLRWADLDVAGAAITVKSDAAEGRRTKSGGRHAWCP